QVNHHYYRYVADALDDLQRLTLTRLLSREEGEVTSAWQRLKQEPQQPTAKRIRAHLTHVQWLQSLPTVSQALESVPEPKLQRFAEEARALNVTRMNTLPEPKRYAFAVALIRVRTAQALDDLVEMCLRRVQKLHQQAKEALADYREQHHRSRPMPS